MNSTNFYILSFRYGVVFAVKDVKTGVEGVIKVAKQMSSANSTCEFEGFILERIFRSVSLTDLSFYCVFRCQVPASCAFSTKECWLIITETAWNSLCWRKQKFQFLSGLTRRQITRSVEFVFVRYEFRKS